MLEDALIKIEIGLTHACVCPGNGPCYTAPWCIFTHTRGSGTYPNGLGGPRATLCLPPRARNACAALRPEASAAAAEPSAVPSRALCAVALFHVRLEERSPEVAAAVGRVGFGFGEASCAEFETAKISESESAWAWGAREPSLLAPPFLRGYIRLSRDGRFRDVTNCSGRRVDVCAGFRTDVPVGRDDSEDPLEKTSASNSR